MCSLGTADCGRCSCTCPHDHPPVPPSFSNLPPTTLPEPGAVGLFHSTAAHSRLAPAQTIPTAHSHLMAWMTPLFPTAALWTNASTRTQIYTGLTNPTVAHTLHKHTSVRTFQTLWTFWRVNMLKYFIFWMDITDTFEQTNEESLKESKLAYWVEIL